MDVFVEQNGLTGTKPVVFNVCNFTKPAAGQPALLSFSDATTMFHEFGHALHGMFSNVKYPSIAGTSTSRDFVEFPSQFNEHWFMHPQVLKQFARHYQTCKPLPELLLRKIKAARNFNQGFATVEYLVSAIVDLDLHALEDADHLDVDAFETETLHRIGAPAEIGMRHCIPHFQHIIGGYASGYYSYMWSEVMDAGGRRHLRRQARPEAPRQHLFRRRHARPGQALQGLPRPPAQGAGAAGEARGGRNLTVGFRCQDKVPGRF